MSDETKNKANPTFEDSRIGQDLQPIVITDKLWEAVQQGADELPQECTPEQFLTLCVIYGVDNIEDIYDHIT